MIWTNWNLDSVCIEYSNRKSCYSPVNLYPTPPLQIKTACSSFKDPRPQYSRVFEYFSTSRGIWTVKRVNILFWRIYRTPPGPRLRALDPLVVSSICRGGSRVWIDKLTREYWLRRWAQDTPQIIIGRWLLLLPHIQCLLSLLVSLTL